MQTYTGPLTLTADTIVWARLRTIDGEWSNLVQVEFEVDTIPGDYDRDGAVAVSDYAVWRSTFGSTNDLRADGNDDGIVDAADYTLWRDNLVVTIPGDYDRDGAVSVSDYVVWRSTFGSTNDLRADGNDDGIVDAADYTI